MRKGNNETKQHFFHETFQPCALAWGWTTALQSGPQRE